MIPLESAQAGAQLISTPAQRVFMMPGAPQRAVIPRASHDAEVRRVLERVALLHLVAWAGLYGAPPAGVNLRCIHHARGREPREPRVMAILPADATSEQAAWCDAFMAGLDTWEEGGLQVDPVHYEPADDDRLDVWVTGRADAIRQICREHLRRDRTFALINLASFLGAEMPAEFNPNSTSFRGSAP